VSSSRCADVDSAARTLSSAACSVSTKGIRRMSTACWPTAMSSAAWRASKFTGGKRVRAVERVATAAPALGAERQVGVAQRVEVAVDRAHRHAEAFREDLGRDAGASAAQVLGEREESLCASHVASARWAAGGSQATVREEMHRPTC
jgi:hypothetical protein